MENPVQKTANLVLFATLYIDPANVDEFLRHLRPAYEAVCVEPELQFFEVTVSQDEPGKIRFVEGWNATKKWFMEVSP